MSSVASTRARFRAQVRALPRTGVHPDGALAIALGAIFCAVAFGADGGLQLEPTTWTEVALVLGGGAVAACALVLTPEGRFWGGITLALLGALAAFTALSIVWSVQPADSWLEASRTLAYLAAFAAALALARLAPDRWAGLLGGVLIAAVAVCGYALLTKVFPEWLAEDEIYARLREPFGYWNSVGLMAALGAPACLWLGARRHGHAALNALAYPALALLLVTILLAYSRGSILALGIGLAVWFAIVPLRLRSATVLLTSAAGAAAVTAWTFSREALTEDRIALGARSDDGHALGALLVLMVIAMLIAGAVIGFAATRRPPGADTRRRAGIALLVALALLPVGGAAGLALSDRGFSGSISKGWNDLTDPEARTPANDPGRLTAAGSVRARYWREAWSMWEESKWRGVGAGGYATARSRHRKDTLDVRHAHGYAIQTLSDLGLIGLGISLALLAAWLAAAARATGLRRRDRGKPFTPERIGLLAIGVIVVVFGVHSFVDWTWFVPGNAVLALACAGFLAGRGPLGEQPRGAVVAGEQPRGAVLAGLRARMRTAPHRPIAAALVVAVAAACAWAVWQPLRGVHAGNDALLYLSRGNPDAARETALIGRDRNPLSVEPLYELAVIEQAAGNLPLARVWLERAVSQQPANPETWRRLAEFELARDQPRRALAAVRGALYLDPRSLEAQSQFVLAQRAVDADG